MKSPACLDCHNQSEPIGHRVRCAQGAHVLHWKVLTSALPALMLLGCADLVSEKPTAAEQPAADANPAAPEQKPVKPTHFRKRVAELVDLKKAMAENDKLVDIGRNRINSSGYVTSIAQGYFAAASRLQLLQLEHTINLEHAANDSYPTFEEFSKLIKQFGIKLGSLYEYQMYGYDDQTAEITILEDRAYKKRIYEAAGREYPHQE